MELTDILEDSITWCTKMYKKILTYAMAGTMAYMSSGCANLNLQAKVEGNYQAPKPTLSLSTQFGQGVETQNMYAALPLEKRVVTDASSSNSTAKSKDKPFYKTWWFIGGVGLLAVGGAAIALSGGKGDSPPASGPAPNPTPTPDPCPEGNCGQ